jgi:ferredoxin-type protein NapF
MKFRTIIQFFSLAAFLFLMMSAVYSGIDLVAPDLYLRMDPVLVLGSTLSGRLFLFTFLPALIVVILTILSGRIFCGYLCPMGITIDFSDRLMKLKKKKGKGRERLYRLKYFILFFIIGSGIFGVSAVFIGAPLSLITRFYALLIHPVLSLLSQIGLGLIQPVAEHFELYGLMYSEISAPRYSTIFFILLFFAGIFAAGKINSRFWCRYLCPSGAILALFSRISLIKRVVSDDCTKCGKCARSCPMGAIEKESPGDTAFSECIGCMTCVNVCPEKAVTFRAKNKKRNNDVPDFLPERRALLYSGVSGAIFASVNLSGLNSLYGKPGEGRVNPKGLVRPPGSRPEKDFLALCVRCGECMASCPNNALQPIWFEAGNQGLFSPSLVPKRGACNQDCNNCGTVCPTSAIRPLGIAERRWAKTGTARIMRERCLAWEQQKRCMVCDEVCPYSAIKFRNEQGNPVPVPEVLEERCSGCGFCEHHCPVQNQSAIFVTPMGALRLNEGSFMEQGKSQGLNISLAHKGKKESASGEEYLYETSQEHEGEAPGFESDAPGFESAAPGLEGGSSENEDGSSGSDKKVNEGLAPGFTE